MRRSGVGSENAHFSPSSQVVLRLHIRGSHFENRTLQPFPVSSVTDNDLTKDLLSFLSPSFLSSIFSFSSPPFPSPPLLPLLSIPSLLPSCPFSQYLPSPFPFPLAPYPSPPLSSLPPLLSLHFCLPPLFPLCLGCFCFGWWFKLSHPNQMTLRERRPLGLFLSCVFKNKDNKGTLSITLGFD